MSLIKNNIPILEYDTNSMAVNMPGHSTNFHFPERAVMLFMVELAARRYILSLFATFTRSQT